MEPLPPPTAEQVERAVALIREEKTRGDVAALRAAGVQGSRGQLRQLIAADEDLAAALREARGWNLTEVHHSLWEVAADKNHPHWDRANARLLKAMDPRFRDVSRHELTGSGGGPIALIAGRFDPDQLTLEELETLKALAAKATPKEIDNGAG